jgi:hypothetical protein
VNAATTTTEKREGGQRFHFRLVDARRIVGTPIAGEDDQEAKARGLFVEAVLRRDTWQVTVYSRGDVGFRFYARDEDEIRDVCEEVRGSQPQEWKITLSLPPVGDEDNPAYASAAERAEFERRFTSDIQFRFDGPGYGGGWRVRAMWAGERLYVNWASSESEAVHLIRSAAFDFLGRLRRGELLQESRQQKELS